MARFFQIAIHFDPDHPWPKALIYSFSALREPIFNPLNSDIKMHILLTVLHPFLMELVRRICLNIKTS